MGPLLGDPGSRLTQEFVELGSRKVGVLVKRQSTGKDPPICHCIPRSEEPGTNLPLSCGSPHTGYLIIARLVL